MMRALTACGVPRQRTTARWPEPYFAEAAELARELGDSWSLGQIIALEAMTALAWRRTRRGAVGRRGRTSDRRGHRRRLRCRQWRYVLGWAQLLCGDLTGAPAGSVRWSRNALAAHDLAFAVTVSTTRTCALAYLGDVGRRSKAAEQPASAYPSSSSSTTGLAHAASGTCTWPRAMHPPPGRHMKQRANAPPCTPRRRGYTPGRPLAPLACGDLAAARRWADDVVSATRAGVWRPR